jgi:hypothetical protein
MILSMFALNMILSMTLPIIDLNMIALPMTLFMNYCTADFLAHSLVIIDLNLVKSWVDSS